MPDNRYRQIATDTDRQLALAYIALTGEHATAGLMHALTILDGLLPLPGTASRREAFAWAHEQLTAA
jgi:hypothetical protein